MMVIYSLIRKKKLVSIFHRNLINRFELLVQLADALTSSIGALEYFDRKKKQFYSHGTLDFPILNQDEVELVKNDSKLCSYYQDGLDIFGGPGVFVQRTKPGIPSPDESH